MTQTIELEGLEFTGAEPTDKKPLEGLLGKCNNEQEKQAVCELWNNSCETVGYFTTVMGPALLADLRHNWEG